MSGAQRRRHSADLSIQTMPSVASVGRCAGQLGVKFGCCSKPCDVARRFVLHIADRSNARRGSSVRCQQPTWPAMDLP